MKNSINILLVAVFEAIIYFIEKYYNYQVEPTLLYFSMALICTFWIVKSIEDK